MIGTKLYKGKFTNEEYANEAVWCNENGAMIVDKGEYYETVEIPGPTEEEQQAQMKSIRDRYFETYVDWYQSKPLYWEEMDETEKTYIAEYRQYLIGYDKTEDWWKAEPLSYEEWLVAHHPVTK